MKPSLFSLFRRGRYVRRRWHDELGEVAGEEEERERKEEERFAVAAIAFCIEHCPSFRRHFLLSVCGHKAEHADDLEVIIEDKQWGDLVLETRQSVYVIECKINAALDDKQNPDKGDKFWKSGYGHQIRENYKGSTKVIQYIVLGKDGLSLKEGAFECFQKQWSHLEHDFPKNGFARDLYECLGQLGVGIFRTHRTDNMKKAMNAKSASETYGLLKDVLTELGLNEVRATPQISFEKADEWYFGITLKKRQSPKGKLKTLQEDVAAETSNLGWLGYAAGDKDDEPILSVWFYCDGRNATVLKDRLVRNKIPEAIVEAPAADEHGGHSIKIEQPAKVVAARSPTGGDKEWFRSVFEAMLKR